MAENDGDLDDTDNIVQFNARDAKFINLQKKGKNSTAKESDEAVEEDEIIEEP